MTAFASQRVYEVWIQLVQDEELYEAMLDGSHAQLAGRGLGAEAIAILDRSAWCGRCWTSRSSLHDGT